ncbi:hypothetical protein F2Q70_00003203 [Brassica cretica]|uniref:Uncharacterized protein n=1 Tax=Brassica cretica TaxID=69181 RepID=A0A8S9IUD6_BRACR|nr:hypothetical protein F2Q70_00003203 [Brassica cretica]KAF3568426.1 hypothetical protein DY000_02014905 [Brassica cretica]
MTYNGERCSRGSSNNLHVNEHVDYVEIKVSMETLTYETREHRSRHESVVTWEKRNLKALVILENSVRSQGVWGSLPCDGETRVESVEMKDLRHRKLDLEIAFVIPSRAALMSYL